MYITSPDNFVKWFRAEVPGACREITAQDIRFHDARHTQASLTLKQGIHPKIVQECLGHSTIAITLDTYSHIAPGLQDTAAKLFDDALQVRHNDNVHV
jgi:integrase